MLSNQTVASKLNPALTSAACSSAKQLRRFHCDFVEPERRTNGYMPIYLANFIQMNFRIKLSLALNSVEIKL